VLQLARTRTGAVLRRHAQESVRSAALNTIEGAARKSRADKQRMFAIARAEKSPSRSAPSPVASSTPCSRSANA
jgi:hypothetical protein